MKSLKVKIPSSLGHAIPAIYAEPVHHCEKRVIVMLHGITTNKSEYLNFFDTMSDLFISNGFSTLRFDFAGHGESSLETHSFTIASQLADLSSVYEWLASNKNATKINLFGCSFGAPPCLWWAAQFPQWTGGMVLLSPVLSYEESFLRPRSSWGKSLFSNLAIRSLIQNECVQITESFSMSSAIVAEMTSIDLRPMIKATVDTKISIIHGEEDEMIDISTSRSVASTSANFTLTSVPNMEHGFTAKGDENGESVETKSNITLILSICVDAFK